MVTGVPQRRLRAAQLAGAAAIGILGAFVVEMPGGCFDARGYPTAVAAVCAAGFCVLAVAGVFSTLGAYRVAGLLRPLLLCGIVVLFLPALGTDPLIAGGIETWCIVLLTRDLFPYRPPARREARVPVETDWVAINGPAVRHLLFVSLLATIVVAGYGIGDRFAAPLVCLLLAFLSLGMTTPRLVECSRTGRRWPVIPMLLILGALPACVRPPLALTFLGIAQAFVLLLFFQPGPRIREIIRLLYGRPALLVLGSFIVLIGLGTMALTFPSAARSGESIDFIDALFTATSASCVTGLIVLDTPGDFSLFGQVVILVLIQAGGLSIMVLSTFAAVMLGHGLGLRQGRAMEEMLSVSPGRSAYPLIRFIVISTFALEAAGAMILTAVHSSHGSNLATSVWNGVFHSVSAFCNAGFALQSDSLIRFHGDPVYLLTIILLITLGGLGFAVLAAGWNRLRGGRTAHVATQVKIVLVVSAVLVLTGGLWYALAEWNRTLATLPPALKVLNALFQSVTLRTAGFNSVDLAPLGASTMLMLMLFMWIGASPGGTGGGIKTTTAAVLVSAIPGLARGGGRVTLFGRRITLDTIYRSAAIAVTSTLIAFGALTVLLATQRMSFEVALFEVISALGTVGLSIGGTVALDTVGKLVIAVTMLLGRTGPLTLALLLGRDGPAKVLRPEARIMVG
jgi:trk system potassium uptake protein TrkH